jgi:hypothetical protein
MRRAHTFDRKVMELLGTDWGGNSNPPTDNYVLRVRHDDFTHVWSVGNDGMELWVGYPDEWLFHCSMREARRAAWFILWDVWARGSWFGLRLWLWYRALHRAVRRPT